MQNENLKKSWSSPSKLKGSIFGTLALLAVLILAALIVALVVLSPSAPSNQSQLPKFQNTNGTVPQAFSSAIGQSGPQTAANLAILAQTGIATALQFNVSYGGQIYAQPSGVVGDVAHLNSPVYVKESKYGNNLKFSVNVTSVPIVGVGDLIYLNLTNGTYTCTNLNVSATTNGLSLTSLSANRKITCAKSNTLVGLNMANLTNFDLSELGMYGLQLNYHKPYQSIYKGTPCTYIAGNMTQTTTNGTVTGTGEFGECMSDTYYVPLSLSVYINTKGVVASVNINETSISNQSNQSYVESLPGPVVG